MLPSDADLLLSNAAAFLERVEDVLSHPVPVSERRHSDPGDWTRSAVLFLLAPCTGRRRPEPCLILNKRSRVVKQAGDLCCPGGGIAPRLDSMLAKTLELPGFPMRRFRASRATGPDQRILVAAALREAFEEMRLLPVNVSYLGMLPPQRLRVLRRAIYPAVAWLHRPQRFRPNWEVESIVTLPLRDLLEPSRYGRLRIQFGGLRGMPDRVPEEFVCFKPHDAEENQVLWGATFRMVEQFLELVFGFAPPPIESLPSVEAKLDEAYLTGRPR